MHEGDRSLEPETMCGHRFQDVSQRTREVVRVCVGESRTRCKQAPETLFTDRLRTHLYFVQAWASPAVVEIISPSPRRIFFPNRPEFFASAGIPRHASNSVGNIVRGINDAQG